VKLTVLFIFLVFSLGQSPLQADDNIFPDAGHPDNEGYHNIVWHTSLKEFKALQKFSAAAPTNPDENAAIGHLLMNLQEAAPATYPFAKTDIEQIPGDKTNYVFYHNHFCLAALRIEPKSIQKAQTFLASQYVPKSLTTHILSENGQKKIKVDYQLYGTKSFYNDYMDTDIATRVYLVTIFAASSHHPKTPIAALLIHASNDYFNSSHNAWADYQSQTKK
jgi:hypothetical protein